MARAHSLLFVGAVSLSWSLCSAADEGSEDPADEDQCYNCAIIGTSVVLAFVLLIVVGVLIMAAKEEDRPNTKILVGVNTAEQSVGDDSLSVRSDPSPANPPEPREQTVA